MSILSIPWNTLKLIWKGVMYVRDVFVNFSNRSVDSSKKAVGKFDDPEVQEISDGFFYSVKLFLKWSIKYPGFPGIFPIAPITAGVLWVSKVQAFPLPF